MSDVFSRYLRNNPAPRKPPPRPAATRPAVSPQGRLVPPRPPDVSAYLQELAAGVPTRSEEEWDALLAPRIQPYLDAINQSTNTARGMNEYRMEQGAAANQGLGEAFLKLLTGGRTGDEAAAYAKEQFGGSYLPAQAMQIAADELRRITSDFNAQDWEITGQYVQAMNQIPGIRDELRAKVEQGDRDDYANRVHSASLLIDESWRYYTANRDVFDKDRAAAEERRQFDEQIGLAKGELGVKGVNAATSAENAALRKAELELKEAREARAKVKDKASIRQADARIRIAQEKLRMQKVKDSKKSSGAQKAEADLAVKILTQERDTILGTKSASGVGSGGMSYPDAYEYVYGIAEPVLSQYGRSKAYINQWVRARLRSLGLGKVGASAAKPRGG